MKIHSLNKYYSLTILILFLSFMDSAAQWNFNLSTGQELSSNPFRSPFAQTELVSSFDLGAEKEFDDLSILYYGSYNGFNKTIDRNFYWHQFGIYHNNDSTMFGLYGEQRINKMYYNFFDYMGFTGYYKNQFYFEFATTTFNLSASSKTYSNLSQYDNFSVNGGFTLNRSFETKTTLILNSSFNYKYYNNASKQIYMVDETEVTEGNNIANEVSNYTAQIYNNFRIAQSLFENTGLALYYINRALLTDNQYSANDISFSSANESDLFDDPFSRNENSLGLELTQVISDDLILKSGYEYSQRYYPSQGIYINDVDYDLSTKRTDKQNYFYISANKIFSLNDNEDLFLQLGLNYNVIQKYSNSFWHDYDANQLSLNLSLQF